MGYLNEDGLARYDGLLKNWVTFKSGTVDGVDPLLNWQRTDTAGAVTFYPLPAAPIDPTVNFLFTESGPDSGTKGPDNPSTITGVSEVKVTRCGKNLFKTPFQTSNTITLRGVTFTIDNEHGTITVDGTATNGDATIYVSGLTVHPRLVGGKTYTMSGCPSGGSTSTYFLGANRYNLDGSYGAGLASDTGSGATWTYANSDWFPVCPITIKNGTTVSNLVFKPQLELGSAATAFEPYEGADYTVNLGGTFYGGSVDLSAGVMTVTYRAFELTPSNLNIRTPAEIASGVWNVPCIQLLNENYVNVFGYNTSAGYNGSNYFCNMLDWNASGSTVSYHFSSSNFYMAIEADSASAATSYISSLVAEKYAAGTPVFAGYPLATTYTVQLTPTQIYSLSQLDPYTPRINTVYSDQVSVQVGYPKSPQATATELTNAIVSLGSNL